MNFVPYLLALYIITKPFYLWSSGLPQISDVILLITFLLVLFFAGKSKVAGIIKDNKFFFFFLIFVIIINSLYSIYYSDLDFLLRITYYVFDALGIIIFVFAVGQIDRTKHILKCSFKISLLIQLLIFLLHVGRYYGVIRYMGTFNDPNQFAYYILLSFGFIYLLSIKYRNKWDIIYFLIAAFLILQSGSTGMLAGMAIFVVIYLILFFKKLIKNMKRYIASIFFGVILLCFGLCVFFILPNSDKYINDLSGMSIFSRVDEKIDKANGEKGVSLWQERGYDRILYYPQYLLFGAGEGGYVRFEKAYHQGEFHATLPSILFCYGIVPFSFLIIWIYQKIKTARLDILCIYLALLLESFTLVNSRQVLFWAILVLCPYIMIDYNNNLKIGGSQNAES